MTRLSSRVCSDGVSQPIEPGQSAGHLHVRGPCVIKGSIRWWYRRYEPAPGDTLITNYQRSSRNWG